MRSTTFRLKPLIAATTAAIACSLVAACSSHGSSGTQAGDEQGLVIASYGDLYTGATKQYFADPFAKANGNLKVTFAPSLAGGAVAAIHAQNSANKVQWDILDGFNGIDSWQLYRDGMLVELSKQQQSMLAKNLAPGMVTPFGFSYGNTTNLLACNADAVKACPTNAKEFFDVKNFPGPRTMFAQDPLPALAMAALADGADKNNLYPIDIDKAFAKLESIRNDIRVFYTSADQSQQIMLSGEASMGILWDGRAFELAQKGLKDIKVTFNDGLYEPWYLAAVKGGPDPRNAVAYLNWVASHPEGATGWMDTLGYGIPMPAAFDKLSAEKAAQIGDNPSNLALAAKVDYNWYLDNRAEIDKRWREYVAG